MQPGVGRVPYEFWCPNHPDGKRCQGFMRSQFYDLGKAGMNATPTHEWYSPQIAELTSWFKMWKHTNNQLFLREIACRK